MVHDRAPELPVLITENGAAYVDVVEADGTVQDKDRQHYFELHVDACREAVRRGLPLQGYFAWSLMDNYEWAFGYTKRFGIVHVDYDTQVRTVKASGRWFAELLS
jgi:beta-glucosidase